MILVSTEVGSKELHPIIKRIGVATELTQLQFADFMFEGNGPKGRISVGVERKTIRDMLACIEDSRYTAHQKVGMKEMYDMSFLIIEGAWRPHDPDGWLMQLYDGARWGHCNPGGRRVLYSKLRRYLFSVSLSEVVVLFSRDPFQTAYDVCELYHYFQKNWSSHTALLDKQKLHLPDLNSKPSLVRRWAAELEDIGVKYSIEAAHTFKTPIRLATSDEQEWLGIKGIGVKTAQKIVREINGW